MAHSDYTSQKVGDEIPVTPGIHHTGNTEYFENRPTTSSEKRAFDPNGATPGPNWNPNRFDDATEDSAGPSLVSRLAKLSTTDIKDDPVKQFPALGLSGRVISATFTVPYTIGFSPGNDWDLQPRRGTSALFDSLSYLASSSSAWNHTLIGWTGELQKSPGANNSNQIMMPLSKLSQPITLPGMTQPDFVDPKAPLCISKSDRQRLEKQLERDHGGRIVPVWLGEKAGDGKKDDTYIIQNQERWRKYARKELYPLLHYKQNEPQDGISQRNAWLDYLKMNISFAERIMDVYHPGDIVMIHDYALMLVPSMLRQKIPNIYIGFFLHTPFPSSEYFRCLARRKDLLEGMLGANMVGFQAVGYARHFSSCCTRILGFDSSADGVEAFGSQVAVDVMPIGINAHATEKAAFLDPKVEENMERLKTMYAGKKIIIGRDRLDAVRGIAQKLQAYEQFLQMYPEWEDQVVLIQITSPTDMNTKGRTGEQEASQKLSETLARINGEYGSIGFSPVRHLPHYLSKEEYFALLRVADLALITSVRDGMNTVSMEYAICQKDNHGPLILSEFSGTSNNLPGAVTVNPFNLSGVAIAINDALTMKPAERKARGEALYRRVKTHNVQNWTDSFIQRLLGNLEGFDHQYTTPLLDRHAMARCYRDAKKRLFMFDYDGTLTPIVQDPKSAVPSDKVIRQLKTLAADPKNAVWIISGRDQEFLEQWMGHITDLGLSAEHGSFIRYPRSEEWIDVTEEFGKAWQEDVLKIYNKYTDQTQGSFVERKRVAMTWHYRRADPEFGAHQARLARAELEQTVARDWDVDVMTGKANLEVRPKFVNKGEIVKRLIQESEDRNEMPDFVFCSGDDHTDEDMFRALNQSKLPKENVYAVTVGPSSKQTLAQWHVLDPGEVLGVIGLCTDTPDAKDASIMAMLDGVPNHFDGQE